MSRISSSLHPAAQLAASQFARIVRRAAPGGPAGPAGPTSPVGPGGPGSPFAPSNAWPQPARPAATAIAVTMWSSRTPNPLFSTQSGQELCPKASPQASKPRWGVVVTGRRAERTSTPSPFHRDRAIKSGWPALVAPRAGFEPATNRLTAGCSTT